MQPKHNGPEGRVGEHAYRQQVDRAVSGVLVGDDHPTTPVNAKVLSKATSLASTGDFLGAIRVLGDVHIEVGDAYGENLQPDDVEQALGDLRRALAKAPAGAEQDASARLLQAARSEASAARWQAAWDLIEEADERLARAFYGE